MSSTVSTTPIAIAIKISDLTNKLNALNSELKTGKPNLTSAQQTDVVNLSNKAVQYSNAHKSINDAKANISLAQSKLTEIVSVLNKMQGLAMQATVNVTNDVNLSNQYYNLFQQIGKLAIGAGTKQGNLLNGTIGLYVQTGLDNTFKSLTLLNSVDVANITTFGPLSGSLIDSKEHAMTAIDSIRSSLATIDQAQFTLKQNLKTLTDKETLLNNGEQTNTNTLNNLTQIDKTKVTNEISTLKRQIDVYKLINSM
jgi:flagellin-like hook-associated protein FlgL